MFSRSSFRELIIIPLYVTVYVCLFSDFNFHVFFEHLRKINHAKITRYTVYEIILH